MFFRDLLQGLRDTQEIATSFTAAGYVFANPVARAARHPRDRDSALGRRSVAGRSVARAARHPRDRDEVSENSSDREILCWLQGLRDTQEIATWMSASGTGRSTVLQGLRDTQEIATSRTGTPRTARATLQGLRDTQEIATRSVDVCFGKKAARRLGDHAHPRLQRALRCSGTSHPRRTTEPRLQGVASPLLAQA
jgi:predicted Fe-S protein YdhL (DUF1289 family)